MTLFHRAGQLGSRPHNTVWLVYISVLYTLVRSCLSGWAKIHALSVLGSRLCPRSRVSTYDMGAAIHTWQHNHWHWHWQHIL